jgi:hypothetical protein
MGYPSVSTTRSNPWYGGQLGVEGSDLCDGLKTAGGCTYYVGAVATWTTAADVHDGTDPMNPKATIQSALDACTDGNGDTVVILPGTYRIDTTLTMTLDGVRLIGVGWPQGQLGSLVFLDCDDDLDILNIDANDIEIAGIHFDQTGNESFEAIEVAPTVSTSGLHIHHCQFTMGDNGIYLGEGADTWADDVEIDHCAFLEGFDSTTSSGIIIDRSRRVLIHDNYFHFNTDNVNYGINCVNTSNPGVIIKDNDFVFTAAGTGIFRAGTTVDVSMQDNLFSGTMTGITQLVDGGTRAVWNYLANNAGGALVDATT